MSTHQFFGVQVTLTASAIGNLLKLLQAVDSSIPPTVRSLRIQVDPSISSGTIYVGDAAVSATRNGYAMVASATTPPFLAFDTGSVQDVPLGAFFRFTTTASVKINVLGWV